MNEKKTFKQRAKDWWNTNKRVIGAGIAFGTLGVAFGFIKGAGVTNEMWLEHGFVRADYDGDMIEGGCDSVDDCGCASDAVDNG